MGRIHLFEFEDQAWFPSFLRDYGTDFLQFIASKTKAFSPVVPVLLNGIGKSKTDRIIDLCSGGGGGLITLNDELKKNVPSIHITLTDLYPNRRTINYIEKQAQNVEYIRQPVDARMLPPDLKGFRTLFLSFHHFRPDDARRILQNAVDYGNGIAVFEGQERSLVSMLGMLFSPLTLLIVTPFIRPFSLGRIIFTYLIPVVPLLVLWDGVISCLRTYSVNEMNEIIQSLDKSKRYNWHTGKLKSGPGNILYLLGTRQ